MARRGGRAAAWPALLALAAVALLLLAALDGADAGVCLTFSTSSGSFTDPDGSGSYSNNYDCSTRISPSTSGTSFITITFSTFNTESSYDTMSLFTSQGYALGPYSGSGLSALPATTMTFGGTYVDQRLVTDSSVTRPGWDGTFSSGTSTSITALSSNTAVSVALSTSSMAYFSFVATSSSPQLTVSPVGSSLATSITVRLRSWTLPSVSTYESIFTSSSASFTTSLSCTSGYYYIMGVQATGSSQTVSLSMNNIGFGTASSAVSLSVGAIIGIAFACVFAFIITCVLALRFRQKCRQACRYMTCRCRCPTVHVSRPRQPQPRAPAAPVAMTNRPTRQKTRKPRAQYTVSKCTMSQRTAGTKYAGCKLTGCYLPRFIEIRQNGNVSDFCCSEHAILLPPPSGERCRLPGCNINSPPQREYCCKTHESMDSQRRAGRMIRSLAPTDYEFQAVQQHFQRRWLKGTPPPIKSISRVIVDSSFRVRYNAYKLELVKDNVTVKSHGGPGNEQRRFHGSAAMCNIGRGVDACCDNLQCRCCNIIRTGYNISIVRQFAHWARFGPGHYFASCSSKSADYPLQPKPGERRIMFVCKVLVGRAEVLLSDKPNLTGPPNGKHSVVGDTGQSLNYDELIVYRDDAAMPRYLIVIE